MKEKVFHNKWFFYEDSKSGKILKAKYENYGSAFATLIVKAPYMENKWSIFGLRFGPIVERYYKIFDSRERDYGHVIRLLKSYDVEETKQRMIKCMNDWVAATGGFENDGRFVHSEYLGNKKLMRDKKIDELL